MIFSQSHAGIPAINNGGTTKYSTAICTICALNIICPSRSTGLPRSHIKTASPTESTSSLYLLSVQALKTFACKKEIKHRNAQQDTKDKGSTSRETQIPLTDSFLHLRRLFKLPPYNCDKRKHSDERDKHP